MSDILSEEEDLARLKSWWGEYGNTVLVSVGVAVVAIVGWRWYDSNQAANIAAASDAYQIYAQASTANKTDALASLAQDHPGTAYYAFALLDQAKQAVDNGDLAGAETHLREAVDAAPHDLLADLARLRLAGVLKGLDQTQAAQAMLSNIKTEGYLSWALEMKGDIHASVGEVAEAHAAYQAALDSLEGDIDRPLLKLKLDNAAPFDGQFVEFESSLDAALTAAADALTAAEAQAEAAADSADSEVEVSAEEGEPAEDEQDTPASATPVED